MAAPKLRSNKGFYILSIIAIIATVLLGIALSLFTYWGFTALDESKINQEFINAVDKRMNIIEDDINDIGLELESVAALYELFPNTSRKEFSSFVAPILQRNKSIESLIWIPAVKGSDRELYEKKAREEGLPSFQFLEQNIELEDPKSKQDLRHAQTREWHYPAYYIEPSSEAPQSAGYDFASHPALAETIEKAKGNHRIALSPRITFFKEKNDSYSVVLMLPVYVDRIVKEDETDKTPQELLGVVAAVVHLSDLINNAMKKVEAAFINIYVYDSESPQDKSFLFFYDMEPWLHRPSPTTVDFLPSTYWSAKRTINFGQRTWVLAFQADEFGYEQDKGLVTEYALDLILGTSVILSIALGLAIWFVIRRIKERDLRNALEDSVKQRTQELGATIDQLKMTQAQLVAQEKLASLGSLTAGIAHELKNPLNFINNFSDLSLGLLPEISEHIEKNKTTVPSTDLEAINEAFNTLKSNLASIGEQGKKANQVILTMLEHAKKTTGQFVLTDIHYILEQSIEKSHKTFEEEHKDINVVIDKEFDVSVGKLDLVVEDIERAFLNILNNAFYAVAEKKKTASDSYTPRISVKTEKMDGKLKVSIRDNGIGIPTELRPRVFTPFFTTKPSGQGAGLGLSLSHDIIVDEHSGTLAFDSVIGEYTELIITLPITQKKQREVIE